MQNINLEHNSLLVSITDSNGILTYVNDDIMKYSGYSEDELIGKSQNIFRHPDVPEEIVSDLCSAMVEGRVWKGFLKNQSKNGNYYWVYAIITKIVLPDGNDGYLGIRSKPTYDEVQMYIDKSVK